MSKSESFLKQWEKVRYWTEDESRMGWHTMSEKEVNWSRNKTARQSARGFYLFVAVGGSRATNRRGIFLRVYASGYSRLREIFRAICQ
jgi:hypothetical protein